MFGVSYHFLFVANMWSQKFSFLVCRPSYSLRALLLVLFRKRTKQFMFHVLNIFMSFFILQYMTDGMLLREFLSEPDLAGYRYAVKFHTISALLTYLQPYCKIVVIVVSVAVFAYISSAKVSPF